MNAHSPPSIGSLCTGYGGLDLAVLAVLGGHVAWVADNDPACARLLATRWPGVPNLGDITEVAGAPCPASTYSPPASRARTSRTPATAAGRSAHDLDQPDRRLWTGAVGWLRALLRLRSATPVGPVADPRRCPTCHARRTSQTGRSTLLNVSGPLLTDPGEFDMPSNPDRPPRIRRPSAPASASTAARTGGGDGDNAAQLLYTPAEAATLLRVPESWLRRRAGARLVPCTFLGRHLRFSPADLAAIVARHARPTGSRRQSRSGPRPGSPT